MMYRNMFVTLMLVLSTCIVTDAATVPQANVFPVPKDMKLLAGAPVTLETGQVAIVLGDKATAPEQYAAGTLQKNVKKRFAQDWTIVSDNADLKNYKALVILGQKSTNKLIDSSCRDLKVNPSEKFPIQDGYALGVGKSGGKAIAVVAGSNPRSVIFGQDTLFQLLKKQGDLLVIPSVSIRDWPSLQHRGRVSSSPTFFATPEIMDALALGRLNFIDLRHGNYGTSYAEKLDEKVIKWVIKEAHKRGMLVYATVSLAVQPPDFDKVMAKFQEFVDLGVDGLWPYLGDPGGEGRSGTPLDLLARVLELGKKHGMTGDLIHYTPGKKGYRDIATIDNFSAAKVPGMENVLWFFAVKPTPQAQADAKSLGLKKGYIWWNHWPHPRGGFTSCGNPGTRADGKGNLYSDLTPFQDAYQSPTKEELARVPEYADGAIPWGGTVWLQYTVASVLGMWAWAPETNNWQQTRRRVYDYLYGPEMVDTAFEFNDLLNELRSLAYMCADDNPTGDAGWPPVLRDAANLPKCREIIENMNAPLKKLQLGSSKGSLLDDKLMEQYIFEPMRAELAAAKVIIELKRPGLWWNQSQERILMAIREGNAAQALRWNEDAQKRVADEVAQIRKQVDGLVSSGDSEEVWKEKFEKRAGEARYTSSAITLDGELNEQAWQNAPKLGPFRIHNDSETTETSSTAQVLYTDDALYVGLDFGEPNMDKLTAAQTAHDADYWNDDALEIFINTDALGKPYYHFAANSIGTKFEELVSNNGIDGKWDGEWDVKVAKKTDRWTAEVRIPYSTLGATKPENDTMWMCNFARMDRAAPPHKTQGANYKEMSAWGYAPRGQLHNTAMFRPLWFK